MVDVSSTKNPNRKRAEPDFRPHAGDEISRKARTKVTPGHGWTWIVKWGASLFIIAAVVCRSAGIHELDLWLSCVGTCGWCAVGLAWQDRALIVLNSVLTFVLIVGLVSFYFDPATVIGNLTQ